MFKFKPGKGSKLARKKVKKSLRKLREKRKARLAADVLNGKLKPIRYPRTVEQVSPPMIGKDKSKLLFILAIDLIPNPNSASANSLDPVVPVERLDPVVEAEARARTLKAISEIRRQKNRSAEENDPVNSSKTNPVPISPEPEVSNDSGIASIDLISSEDEELQVVPLSPAPTTDAFPESLRKYSGECKEVSRNFRNMEPGSVKSKPWWKYRNSRLLQNLDPEVESRLRNSRETDSGPSRTNTFSSKVFSFAQQRNLAVNTLAMTSGSDSDPTVDSAPLD